MCYGSQWAQAIGVYLAQPAHRSRSLLRVVGWHSLHEDVGSVSTAGTREIREAAGGRRHLTVARPTSTIEGLSPGPLAFFVASRAVSVR